jgi:hypothetical protein
METAAKNGFIKKIDFFSIMEEIKKEFKIFADFVIINHV